MRRTIRLQAGQRLLLAADENSSGSIRRLAQPGDATNYPINEIAAEGTLSLGPFSIDHDYEILSNAAELGMTIESPDDKPLLAGNYLAEITDKAAAVNMLLSALPTEDPIEEGKAWLDGGVLTVSAGPGEP